MQEKNKLPWSKCSGQLHPNLFLSISMIFCIWERAVIYGVSSLETQKLVSCIEKSETHHSPSSSSLQVFLKKEVPWELMSVWLWHIPRTGKGWPRWSGTAGDGRHGGHKAAEHGVGTDTGLAAAGVNKPGGATCAMLGPASGEGAGKGAVGWASREAWWDRKPQVALAVIFSSMLSFLWCCDLGNYTSECEYQGNSSQLPWESPSIVEKSKHRVLVLKSKHRV